MTLPAVIRNFQNKVRRAIPSRSQFVKFINEAFFDYRDEGVTQQKSKSDENRKPVGRSVL